MFSKDKDLEVFDDEFDTFWAAVTSSNNEDLKEFRRFPYFPNPHIRSNCFLIDRQLLLKLHFKLKPVKIDCNLFESGAESLSARLQGLGRRLLVVGDNGDAYDVQDWVKSRTFRLEDQSNLLFGDNQTRAFASLFPAEQRILRNMTWGDYIDCPVPKRLKLGFSFEKSDRQLLSFQPRRGRTFEANARAGSKLISIVIPTHNRLASGARGDTTGNLWYLTIVPKNRLSRT